MNWLIREKDAEKLGLKFFRLWGRKYAEFLIENQLEHNNDLMVAYYNRVVLLK